MRTDIKIAWVILRSLIPFVAGASLLTLLSLIVYSGGKRENLAASIETVLIAQVLAFAEKPADRPGLVRVISTSNRDLERLENSPSKEMRDVSLKVYAQLIDTALKQTSAQILVTWVPGAHALGRDDLAPVLDVIREENAASRVWIALANSYLQIVEADLKSSFQFVEGEDCLYVVNLYCTIVPAWKTWIPTIFASHFWTSRKPHALSENLPHTLPNILLNLPTIDSLGSVDASVVLRRPEIINDPHTKLVVIGPDIKQDNFFSASKNEISKTFTAHTKGHEDLENHGIGLHQFWGALAYMLLSDTTIAVMPFWPNFFCAAFLSVIIVWAAARFGSGIAGLVYVIMSSTMVAFDFLLLRYAYAYIPLFDVLYVGAVTVVGATFFTISRTLIQNYSIEADRFAAAELLDLKQNFISLISHNLNTPVAKLRGLIDVLRNRPICAQLPEVFDQLLESVMRLQLLVRTVLLSTTLDQKAWMPKAVSYHEFSRTLTETLKSYCKGFKIELRVNANEEPLNSRTIDPRFYHHLFAIVLYRIFMGEKAKTMEVTVNAAHQLWAIEIQTPYFDESTDFCGDVAKRFVEDFKKNSEISLEWDERGFRLLM